MKSKVPTKTDPTGAPSPLDRHSETLVKPFVRSFGEQLFATAAFIKRAPSKCDDKLCLWATPEALFIYAGDKAFPLYVFSKHISLVLGKCILHIIERNNLAQEKNTVNTETGRQLRHVM